MNSRSGSAEVSPRLTTCESQTFSQSARATVAQAPIETISTVSVPFGAWYSTFSPASRPRSARPSGDPGEMTETSSRRSSMEPTRKRSVPPERFLGRPYLLVQVCVKLTRYRRAK